MRRSYINKIIWVLLFVAIAEIKTILALENKLCDHPKLKEKIIGMLNCSTEEVVHFLNTITGKIVNKTESRYIEVISLKSCFTKNIGTCCDEELKSDIETFLGSGSLIASYYVPKAITNILNTTYVPLPGYEMQFKIAQAPIFIQELVEKYRNKLEI